MGYTTMEAELKDAGVDPEAPRFRTNYVLGRNELCIHAYDVGGMVRVYAVSHDECDSIEVTEQVWSDLVDAASDGFCGGLFNDAHAGWRMARHVRGEEDLLESEDA